MTPWIERAWVMLLSFGLLALMFGPLERAFPARRGQRVLRPAWGTDLLFFAGQSLLWSGLILLALQWLAARLDGWLPATRGVVAGWPWWLQVAAALLAGDLCVYWVHRAQHRFEWLWRFHGVHHTAEHLDWLAAHREHPVDGLITRAAINLPAILLGVPVGAVAGLVVFRGVWAIFIHSNVRLPLGPLEWVLGSPALHHWHHDRDRRAGNYANLNPLMDLLFGTYRRPPTEPEAFGTPEPWPQSYVGLLLHPLRPRRRSSRGGAPVAPDPAGLQDGAHESPQPHPLRASP